MDDVIKITRRKLPHWTLKDSVYFITFRTKYNFLSIKEQILTLNHIKEHNGKFYKLYAAIIMSDHVHLLIEPENKYTLSRIMKGIKGVSARKINKLRQSNGQIWQDESFDRIIRDKNEFDEKLLYMYNNPIKKELTDDTFYYHGWYMNEELC